MQNLYDISTATPLSYLIAAFVIIGLVALFVIIFRRVASQVLSPDGGRNRGPRLGVVDTYSLDRTRQLVIVRRDDVEHLLMIGGPSDILIESNIIRAMSAPVIRETQVPVASYESPSGRPLDNDEPFVAPQPAPVMVPPSTPQAPRLKVSSQTAAPNYAPRAPAESDAQDPAREAFNNAELQALAKRLEASIPPMAPRQDRPAVPQQVTMAPLPEQKPVQQPITQLPISAPPQIQQQTVTPLSTQPVPSTVVPNISAQPIPNTPAQIPQPPIPIVAPPTAQPTPTPQPAFQMPQARAPMMPPAVQLPPQAAPQAPQPQSAPVEPQSEVLKDRQANALDENLRRLLGRKVDPR